MNSRLFEIVNCKVPSISSSDVQWGFTANLSEVRPFICQECQEWPIKKQPKKYSALFLAIVNRLERRESRRPAVEQKSIPSPGYAATPSLLECSVKLAKLLF